MRRILLWQARRRVGTVLDMSHFTPRYMPFEERLCMASDGDFFTALVSGDASIVTDEVETFTETGISLKSGRELEADVIVTATGLNLQLIGGVQLSLDGEQRELNSQMTYKGVLVEDIPNFAWFFGYTNAAWTLKSDISGAYLCRLFKHMDVNGYTVATPHDGENCATDAGVMEDMQSGYIQRAKGIMPRQGSKPPWQVLMHYEKDCRVLLEDPVDDGVLSFDTAPAEVSRVPA
jgi:cation diffusion facilitator CzcD-associated flavoprotein CzcO